MHWPLRRCWTWLGISAVTLLLVLAGTGAFPDLVIITTMTVESDGARPHHIDVFSEVGSLDRLGIVCSSNGFRIDYL
jgi:hypothetical protein